MAFNSINYLQNIFSLDTTVQLDPNNINYKNKNDVPSIWDPGNIKLYGDRKDYANFSFEPVPVQPINENQKSSSTEGLVRVNNTGEVLKLQESIGFAIIARGGKSIIIMEELDGSWLTLEPNNQGRYLGNQMELINPNCFKTKAAMEYYINSLPDAIPEAVAHNIKGVENLQASKLILGKCAQMCENMMDGDENHNTSPLSLAILVGMLLEGINELDQDRLATERGFENGKALREGFRGLYNSASNLTNNQSFTFVVANAMASSDQKTKELIASKLGESFDLTTLSTNANEINSWVKQKTNGMISELDLNAVQIVILNLIAFKAKRKEEFDLQKTTKCIFKNINEGEGKKVDMMLGKKRTKYFQDSGKNQYIELPYKGDMRMIIALPNNIGKFDNLMELDSILLQLQKENAKEVTVQLPKFTFTAKYDLTKLFKDGPIETLLTGYTTHFDGIIQYTAIDTDEQGSEAATVTMAVARSIPMSNSFNADKPFKYYILKGNDQLFVGKVNNP